MIDENGYFYEIDENGNHLYPIKRDRNKSVEPPLHDPEPVSKNLGWKKVDINLERFWNGDSWGPNNIISSKSEGFNSIFRKNNGLSYDYFFHDPRSQQPKCNKDIKFQASDIQVYGKIKAIPENILLNLNQSLNNEQILSVVYVSQISGPEWKGGDGVWKSAWRSQTPSREYIVALTEKKWVVLYAGAQVIKGQGQLGEIESVEKLRRGVKLTLNSKENLTFSQLGSASQLLEAFCIGLGKYHSRSFNKITHQKTKVFEGTYIGGFGYSISENEKVALVFMNSGISVIGSKIICLNWDEVLGIQLGGIGTFQTGGGFFGGGFGVSGALQGIALASILNKLTTKTHFDCIVRIVLSESEISLALNTTPQSLEMAISAGLNYLRKKVKNNNFDSSLGLSNIVSSSSINAEDSQNETSQSSIFCDQCGSKLRISAFYCSNCGNKLQKN